jgi:hypothetical protein
VIDLVTAALRDLGCLPSRSAPTLQIGLTRGDTLWLDVFASKDAFVHVKVSDAVSLREEVRVYHAAYGTFRAFMPEPLGYVVREGWEIFACEGVPHRALLAQHLTRHAARISEFFRAARTGRRPDTGSGHQPLLTRLEAAYAGSRFDAALAPWRTEKGRRELALLGEAPQHGDFTLNNLGLTREGLVVFDWEDFGKVGLPGLDLCTLVVSAFEAHPEGAVDAFAGRSVAGRRLWPLVEPACASLGMDVAQFRRLVPLHLLAFLQLKEGYGGAVRARIDDLLARICADLPRPASEPIHG